MKKKEKKEKQKDNQYKLKKAMAITIGLITLESRTFEALRGISGVNMQT